jgi:putative transposase
MAHFYKIAQSCLDQIARLSGVQTFNLWGTIFATAIGAILPSLHIEIIKRSDRAKGFVILPKRWIVERSIAWLNRCRRLAKDWENLNRTALVFLHFASIRLMLRKLCNPS